MRRRLRNRFSILRNKRFLYLSGCCSFFFIHYFVATVLFRELVPSPITSRLHPDLPLTFDLHSYPVCHPSDHAVENITVSYHGQFKQQTCFLIDQLDGGPWWSYVSQEFAEILTALKEIGIKSNINYRSFNYEIDVDHQTNLTKYILNACHIDEDRYRRDSSPIVILIWDINRMLWHKVADQWKPIFQALNIRLLAFIDDLHYTEKDHQHSRQYLFEFFASEIFSTYAYLFHNYYSNIPSQKITWLPHAASRLSIHSINRAAANRLFVSGANNPEWYPCRARAFALCTYRRYPASCLRHPGYGVTMQNTSAFFYGGQRYFSYMQQYVFGLGTCQSVHYAIAKLFELPANGLALVTTGDLVPILKRLHLYHNEHFLTINCSALYVLKSEAQRLHHLPPDRVDEVRRKGQEVIYERHMTEHRAQLLHVRLLAQALIATASSDTERRQWEEWGRSCR